MKNRVLVIGGGASGMMAAITAAGCGAAVTVLERNEKPLKKLLITGNGRCNLSNLNSYTDSYRTSGGSDFEPEDVMQEFGVRETLSFFEGIGVFTKERDGWVYPCNDQASSVASHLMAEAQRLGVKVKNLEEVKEIRRSGDGFICKTATYEYSSDSVIISTGTGAFYGKNYTSLAGQTADRFSIGHLAYEPALVPLILDEKIIKKWGNDRVRGSVELCRDGKPIVKRTGELQLASYGISGIPILQVSSYIKTSEMNQHSYQIILDLIPDDTIDHITAKAKQVLNRPGIKDPGIALSGILPEKLFRATYQNSMDAEAYIRFIKALKLKVKGKCGMEKAMVCSGGISLGELTQQLESKKVRGLYFTGEAVDVDGDCGGFNLQWAWSSGYAAGKSAAGKENL